eukprot:6193976-Pleurochrysis_carterae.AAC.4
MRRRRDGVQGAGAGRRRVREARAAARPKRGRRKRCTLTSKKRVEDVHKAAMQSRPTLEPTSRRGCIVALAEIAVKPRRGHISVRLLKGAAPG